MPPIFLYIDPATQTSDESGLLIKQRALPVCHPGPYTEVLLPHDKKPLTKLDYIAPLEYYCIKTLFSNVDQLDLGGAPRVLYGGSHDQLRLMKTLIPCFDQSMPSSRIKYVDPRLWATLIQLFSHLPPAFRRYSLPLADTHIPLLQTVNSSVDFTLITVLDLGSRLELNDDTIGALKPLTNLCVLDISGTRVSTWGIKQLSMCLTHDETSGVDFGPWTLRILSMKDCRKVRSDVVPILRKFPLLTVVDLRGTFITVPPSSGFESHPSSHLHSCYYPYPPVSWIDSLWASYPKELFSCWTEKPYILHVNSLNYPPPHLNEHPPIIRHHKKVEEDDKVLVLSRDGTRASGTTDDSTLMRNVLARSAKTLFGVLKLRGGERDENESRFGDEDQFGYGGDGDEFDDYGDLDEFDDYGDLDEFDDYPVLDDIWGRLANVTARRLEERNFYISQPWQPCSRIKCNTDKVQSNVGENEEEENDDDVTPQIYPPITEETQLQLMLFRPPPPFADVTRAHSDLKMDTSTTSDAVANKKRRVMDEEVMKKKTKAGIITKTLLNMAGTDFRRNEPACDGAQSISRTEQQQPVSKNPFRAKKREELRVSDDCQIKNIVPSNDSVSTESSNITKPPLPMQSSQKNIAPGKRSCQVRHSEVNTRGFDMKAWATKTKK